jgi:putative thioredoxin
MDTLIDGNTGTGNNWVKDGTTESFNTDVIEASKAQLVLVDLWAPWCGPCKQLGPMLEKVVNSAGGAVTLVKIDIDQNPQIAQALRVQSIPAVFAFKKGQPVDAFMGALPESQIKEFISRNADTPIGPSPVEAAMEEGLEALDSGNMEGALTAFAEILEVEPDNSTAKAHLARVYIKLDQMEAAHNLLDSIPEADRNAAPVSAACAALSLAENAVPSEDLAPLMAKLDTDPENMEVRMELARGLIGSGDYKAGGDHLIELIRRDREWNDAEARKELLKMFEVLGPMHDLSKDFRRQLSALLFS